MIGLTGRAAVELHGRMVTPHFVHWRGWGLAVPLVTIFWLFEVVGAFLTIDAIYPDSLYTPDKAQAAADAWRMIAASLALSAASLFLISRQRSRRASKAAVPSPDEFMWIALKFWPPIVAVFALATLVWSFFAGLSG
jgi:hypothetical protein